VQREDTAFPILSAWPLPRPTDWLQLVNQPQTEAEVEALRCCVNRGRPFGDPNWVMDTAERLGLEWTIRPRGRPLQIWWLSPFTILVAVTFHHPQNLLLQKTAKVELRRPAGLNSPATRSSAGFVMREIQTGLHKPEGATKQRLTKSADNSAPGCFPNCASICLGSRVSFDLPLA
jgi:hypothetical protein